MSLTDRDRKIMLAIVPIALVLAYWFLLLAPKHAEQATLGDQLTQARTEAQAADARLSQVAGAKQRFANDYNTVVSLGKSIPDSLDTPSLLVQLYGAARGTGLAFTEIKTGQRVQAAATSTTSTTAGRPAGTPPATPGASVPGLDSVPLDFTFKGDFFRLADFFHRMKRFVQVANNKVVVRGRLVTINGFSFDGTGQPGFPTITAKIHTTVYLAPKQQGLTAGANPQGPAAVTPASTTHAPPVSTPSTPAAAALPRP
ncbi:MAG: hypothetical protein NVSMB25_06640 [Thermoleophilaceae bacterium]